MVSMRGERRQSEGLLRWTITQSDSWRQAARAAPVDENGDISFWFVEWSELGKVKTLTDVFTGARHFSCLRLPNEGISCAVFQIKPILIEWQERLAAVGGLLELEFCSLWKCHAFETTGFEAPIFG